MEASHAPKRNKLGQLDAIHAELADVDRSIEDLQRRRLELLAQLSSMEPVTGQSLPTFSFALSGSDHSHGLVEYSSTHDVTFQQVAAQHLPASFRTPRGIQEIAVMSALANRDCLGAAGPCSGKTAAYYAASIARQKKKCGYSAHSCSCH